MTEKFKKIGREYVLSDSSVNVYGFRLLTSGYQLDAFQKNPIGYYMHRREDGIALKWEGLRIEDDRIVGTPVINLSNTRGAQTCDEAENGFLNAASVGHIVVLAYSTEPELMLPGQTGPTITKWYNKECSLVDIPGNYNALATLYDEQENELNLLDLGAPITLLRGIENGALAQMQNILGLPADVTGSALVAAIEGAAAKANVLEQENLVLRDERQSFLRQIDELNHAGERNEINNLLDRALEDKKITIRLRERLASDYANNAKGLKEILAAMPAYQSIAEHLKAKQEHTQAGWRWDDYEKNDPSGKKLKELRASDPARYKELFDKKFAA